MNTPNKLTILRVLMIPLYIAAMMLLPPSWNTLVGAAIYGIASATDAIDGHLARKNNEVTDFGKFLDPLADKMLVITALVLLQDFKMIPPLFTVIIIARELMVTSIRLIAASSAGKVIAAGWMGKAKTVTQMVATLLLMVEPVIYKLIAPDSGLLKWFHFAPLGKIFLWAAVILTVVSGIQYLVQNWEFIDYRK
ncbi:MAG: CDP-diacylglycerol--glycerol-3-phosphate 3-phosphatidyltransferase [Clostridia bacterium]|nr:CDP-diacylglycerol--glycerol-3-phosphate 3-phosphatidyltransferase [Clostridia bacterium]